MKVLFQCNAISPYRNNFFNELAKYVDLTVVYETENSEHKHRDKKWFDGLKVEYNKVKLEKKNFLKFTYGDISKVLDKSYDYVILGNYLSLTGIKTLKLCKKLKIKMGVSADGAIVKKDNPISYLLKSHILKKAKFFLSPSSWTDEYFKKYSKKTSIYRYKFTSIQNSDIKEYVERENSKEVKILTVGQFIYRKGFDILLEIAPKINAKILICGGEPTQEYLDLVKSDNVSFLGFKTKEELSLEYQKADIFVLPTREDVWGLVINEAMNYSLPILTTTTCVAGVELLDKEYLFDYTDKVVFISKLNNLISNYELRLELGKKNNEKIKSYTLENMAKETFEILKGIN